MEDLFPKHRKNQVVVYHSLYRAFSFSIGQTDKTCSVKTSAPMQKIKATQRKTEGWGEMQTLPVKGGSVALEYFFHSISSPGVLGHFLWLKCC